MTLLFNLDGNISECKQKLIQKIMETHDPQLLKELYWVMATGNDMDEDEDNESEDTRPLCGSDFVSHRFSA
jgi:hypothetical protein